VVAESLGAPMPVAVPRWSTLLIEPHVARLLEQYKLTPADLADAHAPERALAEGLVPEAVRTAMAGLREAVAATTQRLSELNEAGGEKLVPSTVPAGAATAINH